MRHADPCGRVLTAGCEAVWTGDPLLPAARRARPTAQRRAPGAHRRHRRGRGRGRLDLPRRRRADGRDGGDASSRGSDGRAAYGEHPAAPQPGRRLRLPGLRVARPGARSPAHRGVLRERRQGRRRGGDQPEARPGVLRDPLGGRPRRADRVLAGQAGSDHRADGAAAGCHPLRADHLGRRLHHDGGPPQPLGQPGPGGVLHVGQDVERGSVRLPALRPRARHQQPARLLQHVPRVVAVPR